jgi:hypothetical protein
MKVVVAGPLAAMRSGEQQVLTSADVQGPGAAVRAVLETGQPAPAMLKLLRRRQFPVPRDGGGSMSTWLAEVAIRKCR